MSKDTFALDNFSGLTENSAATQGNSLDTGDIRRKFNFGPRVSLLGIDQNPFFYFMNRFSRSTTDDPEFKFTEERPSFHKRYAYPTGWSTDGASYTTNDATVPAANLAVGQTIFLQMETDYKSAGNIGSRFGNINSKVDVGDSGTRPQFFMANQIVKVNISDTDFETPNEYFLVRVKSVTNGSGEEVFLEGIVTRAPLVSAANVELQWSDATTPMSTTYNVSNNNIEANLESKKATVVGSAFARGSGYPETWADNPYSTGFGQTQIWKTALGMDNTTRATVLKYSPNEFARIWGNKLIEHAWDIETDMFFSSQSTDADGIRYTQGVVDYITNYGQLYSLNHGTKTSDDFLDDLSQFMDPRQQNSKNTVFLCDTFTYNWLNKLSGYFNNTIGINSSQFRGSFDFKGISRNLGVAVMKIETIYGTMNIVRNPHLDGTGYSIVAVNLGKVKYRPLAGNGINRDTSVYVGVQTLENSGVDKRVDLILTEAGLQIEGPEYHCIWRTA